jgi:hypothetical protein
MVCLMGAMDGAATGFMTSDFFGGIGSTVSKASILSK